MNISNYLSIIGSVITFLMAMLQMYVTLRLLKYKEMVKKEVMEDVSKIIIEVYKDIGELARKDVMTEKLLNIEQQIKNASNRRNS